jgi:hypothetical protein
MKYPVTRLVLASVLLAAGVAQARVQPPPLPPGSDRVKPEAGLNEEERKRYVRAHHHKAHHKKDFTKDDSVPDTAAPGNSGGSNAGGNDKGNANGQTKK